jgi:hypothetical protein
MSPKGPPFHDSCLTLGLYLERAAGSSCPPAGTTIRQITDVAVIYLKDHVIERTMPAAMLVQKAIIGAC